MTRVGGWTIGALMLVAACGGEKSARELCEESMQAYCDKVFDCAEGEPLRAAEGGSKAACFTQNITICPVGPPCSGTEPNYHQDKAEACAAQANALTCAEFGMGSNLPVCDEICTP